MSPTEDEKVEKLLTMSASEMSRMEVMNRLEEKRLQQREAAEMLGVSTRQIKRLLSKYRESGASGLVSKRRGKASNNQFSKEVKPLSNRFIR
jgi:transposase